MATKRNLLFHGFHFQVPMLLSFRGCIHLQYWYICSVFRVYSGFNWRFFSPGGGVPSVFSASRGVPRSWRSSHARCRLGSMSWRCRTCRWDRGGMVGPRKGATDLNLYKKLRKHRNQGLKHEKIKYVGSTRMKICKSSAWQKHGSILSDFAWSQVQQTGFPSFFHRSLGQKMNMNPIWKQILWIRRMNCDPPQKWHTDLPSRLLQKISLLKLHQPILVKQAFSLRLITDTCISPASHAPESLTVQ